MLIPARLAILFLLPAYILVDPMSIPLWGAVVLLVLASLQARTGTSPSMLLKRNIFILVFALIMAAFVLVSAYFNNTRVDTRKLFLFLARIFAVYNAVMLTGEWLGRDGFLYVTARVRPARVRLYLLLVFRSVKNFLVMNRYILYQLKSRIDVRSGRRYLVPLYYTRTLITRELFSYHLSQAALYMRVDRDITVYAGLEKANAGESVHALMLCLALAAAIVLNLFGISVTGAMCQ